KTKMNELIDDSFAELVALVGYIFANVFEQYYFLPTFGNNGENIAIFLCDVQQGIIESLGKFGLILKPEQIRNKMFRSHSRGAFGEYCHQHFVFLIRLSF